MGLKELVEVAVDVLSSIDDVIEQLEEEKRAGGNPPPEVSAHQKAMLQWPDAERPTGTRAAWPPFEGHRCPLGGDAA